LGCEDGTLLSRYEKRRWLPPLETTLAREAIFGIPVGELFAGKRQEVGRNIEKRRLALKARLQAKTLKGGAAQINAHKLRRLEGPERPLAANHTSSLA
jgi:hypothetical protein